jgi:hypothetical protein
MPYTVLETRTKLHDSAAKCSETMAKLHAEMDRLITFIRTNRRYWDKSSLTFVPLPSKPNVSSSQLIQEDTCSIASTPENNNERVVPLIKIDQEEALPNDGNNAQTLHEVSLLPPLPPSPARDISSTQTDARPAVLAYIQLSSVLPLVKFCPSKPNYSLGLFRTNAGYTALTYGSSRVKKIHGPVIFDPGTSKFLQLIPQFLKLWHHNAAYSSHFALAHLYRCSDCLLSPVLSKTSALSLLSGLFAHSTQTTYPQLIIISIYLDYRSLKIPSEQYLL